MLIYKYLTSFSRATFSITEKIVTVDKIHYRDKVKTIRITYIPKWVWALLIFNVIYFGWTYKSLFVRLLCKLL